MARNILIIVFISLYAACNAAEPNFEHDFCRDDYYDHLEEIGTAKKSAFAAVYADEKFRTEDYLGTAFFIDAKAGLLVTAAHVVQAAVQKSGGGAATIGSNVLLRVPQHPSGRLDTFSAKLLKLIPPSGKQGGQSTPLRDRPRDLALLKITNRFDEGRFSIVPPAFDRRDPPPVELRSFLGGSPELVGAPGNLTREFATDGAEALSKCTLRFNSEALSGDSGGALIDSRSQLVAMAISNRAVFPSGRAAIEQIGYVLPLNCAAHTISDWLIDENRPRIEEVAKLFFQLEQQKLSEYVGNRVDAEGVTTFEIWAALRLLSRKDGDALLGKEFEPRDLKERFMCPILPALRRRAAPLDAQTQWEVLSAAALSPTSVREFADLFLEEAFKLRDVGEVESASSHSRSATQFYAVHLHSLGLPISSRLDDNVGQIRAVENRLLAAQSFKGFADSLYLTAELDSRTSSKAYHGALVAALNAASVAGNEFAEVAANSMIVAADSAVRLDFWEDARTAYSIALANSKALSTSTQELVRENYDYTFRTQFNVNNPNKLSAFVSIDSLAAEFGSLPYNLETLSAFGSDELRAVRNFGPSFVDG